MARQGGSRVQALVAVSGMMTFLGGLSMAPRISFHRQDDATIIRYQHLKKEPSTPAPADVGVILAPGPIPTPTQPPAGRRAASDTDWIFDTGATTHVCSNRSLLHGYDRVNPYNNRVDPRAVGYFGPNPIAIVGAGDVTFTLPSAAPAKPPSGYWTGGSINASAGSRTETRFVHRLTLKNVSHIPEAGVNLISWSQLKRAKGVQLQLVEHGDGSLVVEDRGQALMRFQLRNGLYFLDQILDVPEQPRSLSG